MEDEKGPQAMSLRAFFHWSQGDSHTYAIPLL